MKQEANQLAQRGSVHLWQICFGNLVAKKATWRKEGQEVSEFAMIFRDVVAQAKDEGILFDEDSLGYHFREKLRLGETRLELLKTATAGEFNHSVLEREALRFFARVHHGEQRNHDPKKPHHHTTFLQRGKDGRWKPRQANVVEPLEEDDGT